MLVDTHCHLGDARFDPDRPEVVARARAAGVDHIVIIGDSAATTDRARALADRFDLTATAGVHPHEASSWSPETAARIAQALDDARVVAVGETGLDYHYEHSPRPVQRRVFEAQLALAADRRRPVVVHARDADDDMAAMVTAWGSRLSALVLHSFSSGVAVFEAGLAAGAYFSFSGMITFRSWHQDRWVAECPLDRLLVETDAPYLAPVPHRGKRNEPAFVTRVAERLAVLRRVPSATLIEHTTANAIRCFGARVAPEDRRAS